MDEEPPPQIPADEELPPKSACGPQAAEAVEMTVTQQTQQQNAASSSSGDPQQMAQLLSGRDHQAAMALASTIRPNEWMEVFHNIIMTHPDLADAMHKQMTVVLQNRGESEEEAEQAEVQQPAAAAATADMSQFNIIIH